MSDQLDNLTRRVRRALAKEGQRLVMPRDLLVHKQLGIHVLDAYNNVVVQKVNVVDLARKMGINTAS